ncbi:MAG TPA: LuxR C-terminal-related transcriptional regulator [Rubellimicrobium sp.]|nr:LuxR C-terminal-related transcriptional regulator [Rubellimicrobium sp.]
MRDPNLLVIALRVGDATLADRLGALLASVPGLRLAVEGEPADVAILEEKGEPAGHAGAEGPDLTPREKEVLELLTEGASNKVIARRLGISVHTAKFHVGRVIDKLDATGRTDAVAHAARTGVIQL